MDMVSGVIALIIWVFVVWWMVNLGNTLRSINRSLGHICEAIEDAGNRSDRRTNEKREPPKVTPLEPHRRDCQGVFRPAEL